MASNDTFMYSLPSGAVIEVENLPDIKRGARDVAAFGNDTSLTPFDQVIAPLGELCQLIFEKIKANVTAPDSVQIELSAALKGKTSFVIVSGETEGALKVTLAWKKNPA
jgi:hypothetical protein